MCLGSLRNLKARAGCIATVGYPEGEGLLAGNDNNSTRTRHTSTVRTFTTGSWWRVAKSLLGMLDIPRTKNVADMGTKPLYRAKLWNGVHSSSQVDSKPNLEV